MIVEVDGDGTVIDTTIVSTITDTVSSIADSLRDTEGDTGLEIEEEEWITLSESAYYLRPLLKILAIAHSMLSLSMLIAYYFLKVSNMMQRP